MTAECTPSSLRPDSDSLGLPDLKLITALPFGFEIPDRYLSKGSIAG